MRYLFAVPIGLALLSPPLAAQTMAASSSVKWGPAPAVFPRGAKMAVLSGDPGKTGLFTIELSLPNGYRLPPHFHPTDELVQIKQGTFLVGMGDKFDLSQTKTMAVGDTGTVPALSHHFATAKGSTIVQVTAMGPFAMTYVHPQDDPQNAKPAGY